MLKKLLPLALAAAVAGTLAGCPDTAERDMGGGAGTADREAVAPEADGQRDNLDLGWGQGLTGSERDFAEAYTRATWVHANLLGGDWEQAQEDIGAVKDRISDLNTDDEVAANVKTQVNQLQPMIEQLDQAIANRDTRSAAMAAQLVSRFSSTGTLLAGLGFLGVEGGGAGKADVDREVTP